jgi:hypothetical protein
VDRVDTESGEAMTKSYAYGTFLRKAIKEVKGSECQAVC